MRKLKNVTKKKAAAIAGSLVVLVGAGGGIAYAYWSTTGSGSGAATTSAGASNLEITQSTAPTNLAPSVAAGGITGTVKNNASNNAFVSSVTVSISVDAPNADASHPCDTSDYTLSNPVMSVDTDLAPNQTFSFSGATLGFNNKAGSNQDGCKGATVNLAYASN
jgi:hypothetical protein